MSVSRIFRQICQKVLIYTIKIHLKHEICQRKFGRVKGALLTPPPPPYLNPCHVVKF